LAFGKGKKRKRGKIKKVSPEPPKQGRLKIQGEQRGEKGTIQFAGKSERFKNEGKGNNKGR